MPIVDLYGNSSTEGGERREPFGRVCGLYDRRERYFRHDTVTHNGSEWRAVKDDPGPLPGDGWRLGAKGSRGRPGEKGEPGLHVKAMNLTGYTVTIELSDGSRLHCNLLPAFELYERERKAGK